MKDEQIPVGDDIVEFAWLAAAFLDLWEEAGARRGGLGDAGVDDTDEIRATSV